MTPTTWVGLLTWELSDQDNGWVLLEREVLSVQVGSPTRVGFLYVVVDVLPLPIPPGSRFPAAHVAWFGCEPDEEPDEEADWHDAILHPTIPPMTVYPHRRLRMDLLSFETREAANEWVKSVGGPPWTQPLSVQQMIED